MNQPRYPGPTGTCDTSLIYKSVGVLQHYCDQRNIDVTPIGLGSPNHTDYLAAIYVYDMGLIIMIDEIQTQIREFMAWLISHEVEYMQKIAKTIFNVTCLVEDKGKICQRVLKYLLKDPELPEIPGFHPHCGDQRTVTKSAGPPLVAQQRAASGLGEPVNDKRALIANTPSRTINDEDLPQIGQTVTKPNIVAKPLVGRSGNAKVLADRTAGSGNPSVTKPQDVNTPEGNNKGCVEDSSKGRDGVVKILEDVLTTIKHNRGTAYLLAPAVAQLAERLRQEGG